MTEPKAAPGAAPSRVAVWDLPTRLFHWALVALIALSWWTAEEHLYELHMWLGSAVLTLLLFRLLWGLVGSSTARFAGLVRGPTHVLAYLRGEWRGIGHSPLGALSVIALLGLIALEVALGLFAGDEDGMVIGFLAHHVSTEVSEIATELHEELFDFLLVLIGLHVAAILFYRLVRGKKLVGPMISGKAEADAGTEPMRPGKSWVALLCLIVAIAVTRWIIAGAPPLGG